MLYARQGKKFKDIFGVPNFPVIWRLVLKIIFFFFCRIPFRANPLLLILFYCLILSSDLTGLGMKIVLKTWLLAKSRHQWCRQFFVEKTRGKVGFRNNTVKVLQWKWQNGLGEHQLTTKEIKHSMRLKNYKFLKAIKRKGEGKNIKYYRDYSDKLLQISSLFSSHTKFHTCRRQIAI